MTLSSPSISRFPPPTPSRLIPASAMTSSAATTSNGDLAALVFGAICGIAVLRCRQWHADRPRRPVRDATGASSPGRRASRARAAGSRAEGGHRLQHIEEGTDACREAQVFDRRVGEDGVGGWAAACEEGAALPLGPCQVIGDADPGLVSKHLGMHGLVPLGLGAGTAPAMRRASTSGGRGPSGGYLTGYLKGWAGLRISSGGRRRCP